jgi:ribulose-5-phosphate 4-epimerase/fuculose-1-phosphate aldolase
MDGEYILTMTCPDTTASGRWFSSNLWTKETKKMAATAVTDTIDDELRGKLEDLAKACRILEINGHGDRIWGHAAMRDPEGRGFWIKRHTISLGEVFDANDFQLTDFDGKPVMGEGKRHSEWPIHGEVFLIRADIDYTAHTHPFYCSIYSAVEDPLRLVRGTELDAPPRYEGSSELIRDKTRGREMAEALGDHMVLFLRNHGVVFCGHDVTELVWNGIDLEVNSEQMLAVNGSGLAWGWAPEEERQKKSNASHSLGSDDPLWDYYCRQLTRAEAAGDIRLSTGPVENR